MWHSQWKSIFDDIVAEGPPSQAAVAQVLEYGERQGLDAPRFYVSTAVSSAGWKRDPRHRAQADIAAVIEENNRTSSLILESLVDDPHSLVSARSMMVPTDLGHVRGWRDIDYLVFYFAWMAGLNFDGAARVSDHLKQPTYKESVDRANDRTLSNDERWPDYQLVTEVLIAQLTLAASQAHTTVGDGATVLVQLVDVEESVGCRAERIFADARGLDVVTPTFSAELEGDLGADVAGLRKLGATVGAPRRQVQLTPVQLR